MIPADVHAAALTATGRAIGGKLSAHQRECIRYVRQEGNVGHVLGAFPEGREYDTAQRRIVRGRV